MDGLDEMAGAGFAHPVGTRLALMLGGDRFQDRRDPLPILLGAADHDRGPVPRTLLAAGDPDAEKRKPHVAHPPRRVVEIGIAGVDDEIVRGEIGFEIGYLLIDRRPGRHHENDGAGTLDRVDESFETLARCDAGGEIAGLDQEIGCL